MASTCRPIFLFPRPSCRPLTVPSFDQSLFGSRKEGKDYGPSNYRSDFPLILRTKRQTIYHWVVSWAVFFVWFGQVVFLLPLRNVSE